VDHTSSKSHAPANESAAAGWHNTVEAGLTESGDVLVISRDPETR